MTRIRNLELLFNLEKKNLKSKEDCVIIVFHCLFLNENHKCVGTGDEWPNIDPITTELLPENWNSDRDVYTLRYSTVDQSSRILLNATRMEHILQIDVVKNKDSVASLSINANEYVSDNYEEYSTAYKDLDPLVEKFRKEIMQKLNETQPQCKTRKIHSPPRGSTVPEIPDHSIPPMHFRDPRDPFPPRVPRNDGRDLSDPLQRPRCPRIGGSDLDPFGHSGGGGMFMDPSSYGFPSRPSLPDFGVGGPGGLPRGAVPPGARFDPFMPPIRRDGPRNPNPNPDYFSPPDFDHYM